MELATPARPDPATVAAAPRTPVAAEAGPTRAAALGPARGAEGPRATAQRATIESLRSSPRAVAQRDSLAAAFGPAAQRVERTTSIYNREQHTNTFHKSMEIIDSTDPAAYVHLSRSVANEHSVDIQQQPDFFNGLREANKGNRVEQAAPDVHAPLGRYTRANNAHVTLEGRYARVMSNLASGLDDVDAVKAGAPVDPEYANLNFGSSVDHDGAHQSDYDLFGYIHNWAEDADEYARMRPEEWEGQKDELVETIGRVHDRTAEFASHLIAASPLRDLPSEDFVHYGGIEWSPILPESLR